LVIGIFIFVSVILLLQLNFSVAATPTDAAVHYNFSAGPGATSATDTAGAHTLTFTNGAAVSAKTNSGWTGETARFDGVNDYAGASDSATLSATSDFTISALFYADSLPTLNSSTTALVGKWDANSLRSYRLYLYNYGGVNYPRFGVSANGTTESYAQGSMPVYANTWYAIAGTQSSSGGGTISLYLNGYQATSSLAGVGSVQDNASAIVLGATKNNTTYSEYFAGLLDEVRLYASVQTPAQMAYRYRKGEALAKFNFDDGAGTYLGNRSGFAPGSRSLTKMPLTNFPGDSAWVVGKYNYGLQFDGSNDYVNLGSGFAVQLGQGLSVSVWLKPDASANILTIVSNTQTGGYRFALASDNELVFGDRDGAPQVTTSGAGITDGSWHHVAVSYDGTTAVFMVDGRFAGSSALSLSRSSGASYAGSDGSGGNYFDGAMDDLFIYPYPRTIAQNAVDYNHGASVSFGGSTTNELTRKPSALAAAAADDTAFICGSSTVSDVDGNSYNTVLIGSQCWQASNMRTTHYPGGAAITKGQAAAGGGGWTTDQALYSCPPNSGNTAEDCAAAATLGMLYQWSAAMHGSTASGAQGICPSGWHIPTDAQIKILEMNWGMSQATADTTGYRGTDEGSRLATDDSGSSTNWTAGNLRSDADFDTSGFNLPPAGYRGTSGSYYYRAYNAGVWSSLESGTNAWYRYLGYSGASVYRNTNSKADGFSVRCLKD
jgi:uncharacterized protein (TIGR02145 family)